jgi:hypothetical protein
MALGRVMESDHERGSVYDSGEFTLFERWSTPPRQRVGARGISRKVPGSEKPRQPAAGIFL